MSTHKIRLEYAHCLTGQRSQCTLRRAETALEDTPGHVCGIIYNNV